jgi:hypothetical protein
MVGVTVFVDDAVCGRLPAVCAKTGGPSDGWLTVESPIGRWGRVGTPWLLVLAFLPPVGWGILLLLALLAPDRTETLTVQVPWTEVAQQRVDALRRRKGALWGAIALSAAGLVATLGLRGDVNVDDMTARAGLAVLVIVAVTAFVGVLVTDSQIVRASIAVGLDGSRRWVTFDHVHPQFRDAVKAQQRRSGAASTP